MQFFRRLGHFEYYLVILVPLQGRKGTMLAPKLKIVANLSCDHSKQVYLVYLNNNNKEVKGPTIEQAIDQLRDLDI